MKQYPSIGRDIRDEKIYAFDKLDGSQIRAEWQPKKGFYKFGTRTRLVSPDELLGKSIELIQLKFEIPLGEIFKKNRITQATCFFEFFGSSSFAGNHVSTDYFDVVLFDIDVYKKGLLPPKEFINLTEGLPYGWTPRILWHGKPTKDFVESVKNSTLDGMTLEGVVCKGKIDRKTKRPIMFKIKSQKWLDELMNRYPERFEEWK